MLRIRQIKIEVLSYTEEKLKKSVANKLRVNESDVISVSIFKRSIDARNKNEIFYVFEVDALIKDESKVLSKIRSADVFVSPDTSYRFNKTGKDVLSNPPVVVGSGPAGLFAAYILAENGYKPVVVERGEDIDNRKKTVDEFWKTGKLNTLVKDKDNRCRKVLETFVKFGAPNNILYDNKPHIGTDLLSKVIKNMREHIISLGGKFLYNTCLTDISYINDNLSAVILNGDKILPCQVLVLAVGHSARDTFEMLYDHGISMSAKSFAIGIRVQHNQDMINLSQYGDKYKDVLPPASYKLTHQAKNGRGVYSFCMCPGGYVVNASGEEGMLAVNGMSYNDRGGENANSAIIVTVTPDDFGKEPLDGIAFQRDLERKAFESCGGKIPTQCLDGFVEGRVTENFGNVKPCFKGGYGFADINGILPTSVCESLKEAFPDFGRKINGFDNGDTILAAVESRTSSPIRIHRDENGESSLKGLYPCGEGAGYAGGITSAAMDGIRIAEYIGMKYKE